MRWFDGIRRTGQNTPPPSQDENKLGNYITLQPSALQIINDVQDLTSTQTILLASSCTLSFLLGLRVGRVRPTWNRFTSVADIPPSSIGTDTPLLRGRVVSVSDSDTLRFLHVPTIFNPRKVRDGEKMSEVALPVRVCTIDTPEVAKFGKPGQPYGDEAKKKLKSMVLNRSVAVRLLHKDQYGRAVGEVRTGWVWPVYGYVDESMLKAGLAEVYTGGGAVYGRLGKDA